MTDSPKGTRLIGWNGLQFHLPLTWEVIVSGPCHLLIEYDFAPVLEIRWHTGGNSTPENIFETTRRHFSSTKSNVSKITIPKPYAIFAKRNGVTAVSWHDDNHLDGLIWQSEVSRTVIFCHLFRHTEASSKEVTALLESLQCNVGIPVPCTWSIQDFTLNLPTGFRYIDSTFKAGLSRIAFTNDNLQLQFCRLAPAATRLTTNSLPQLLSTLLGDVSMDETLIDKESLHECQNNPSTFRQFLSRMRKQRPFHWGRIWHDSQNNRLLSLLAESKHPISLNTVHNLCTHYEIIPFIQKA